MIAIIDTLSRNINTWSGSDGVYDNIAWSEFGVHRREPHENASFQTSGKKYQHGSSTWKSGIKERS